MKKITYNGESKILIALCNSINEIIDNLGNAGDGDMKKSVYDTNGDGIVDNAEKVNGFTVGKSVPSDAIFTDNNTTYTMSLSGQKLTLTDSNSNAQIVTLPTSSSGGGSSSSGSELEITSDAWTPTNEYINGERLYKRYYEKIYTPTRTGYTLLSTFSELNMLSCDFYINLDSSFYDTVGTGNFSPFRSNFDNYYTLCFDASANGLCIYLSNSFLKKELHIRAIISTVESNIVKS